MRKYITKVSPNSVGFLNIRKVVQFIFTIYYRVFDSNSISHRVVSLCNFLTSKFV